MMDYIIVISDSKVLKMYSDEIHFKRPQYLNIIAHFMTKIMVGVGFYFTNEILIWFGN